MPEVGHNDRINQRVETIINFVAKDLNSNCSKEIKTQHDVCPTNFLICSANSDQIRQTYLHACDTDITNTTN